MITQTDFDEKWLDDYCKRIGMPNPLLKPGNAAKETQNRRQPERNKYGNVPTTVDGIRFASKREAARYGELKLMVRAGDICGFSRQQPFLLPGGIRYIADFVLLNRDGTYSVEDAKGVRTDDYKNKKKLMMAHLGIDIVEV